MLVPVSVRRVSGQRYSAFHAGHLRVRAPLVVCVYAVGGASCATGLAWEASVPLRPRNSTRLHPLRSSAARRSPFLRARRLAPARAARPPGASARGPSREASSRDTAPSLAGAPRHPRRTGPAALAQRSSEPSKPPHLTLRLRVRAPAAMLAPLPKTGELGRLRGIRTAPRAEEARRGAERRAERHAAARFGGCAAEHAARRGGCIRPTKHRGAKRRAGDGSGDTGSGSEAEGQRRATNTARGANAACFAAASGAEPARASRVAQDCDPTAYTYTPSGRMDARTGRPSRASTVAAKQAAR